MTKKPETQSCKCNYKIPLAQMRLA